MPFEPIRTGSDYFSRLWAMVFPIPLFYFKFTSKPLKPVSWLQTAFDAFPLPDAIG